MLFSCEDFHGAGFVSCSMASCKCRRSVRHHFGSAWDSCDAEIAFDRKWCGTLRLQSARFADTPTRRYADTAQLRLRLRRAMESVVRLSSSVFELNGGSRF